jgi:hypothetical protein
MSLKSFAPIVLFLYNRPDHTESTLKNLVLAQDAIKTDLYIFCDGPKIHANQQDLENIEKVRQIAESCEGFNSVTITNAEFNKGLGKSIIDGVSHVINKFGKCIVLEDDQLVHCDFIKYMNHYLNFYASEKKIMHVSAFARNSYLQFVMPRVFGSRYMDCWGWGTWADRWSMLDLNLDNVDQYLSNEDNLNRFNFSKLDYHTYFDQNRNNFKTWAIFWYYTIAKNNGLCLMSKYSYVKNIGNDGSGTNEVVKAPELASNFVNKFKPFRPKLKETLLSELYIQDAYAKRSKKRFNRPKRWLHDILSGIRNKITGSTI